MGEIQEITSISEWSHVDTKDNPADIISRGREPNQMFDDTLCWEGPHWLKCDSSQCPSTSKINDSRIVEERRIINLSTAKQPELSFLFRYSILFMIWDITPKQIILAKKCKMSRLKGQLPCKKILYLY